MARRIPMNARDQLLLAREHGHELQITQRGPWPEHGDPHPKYRVTCSCGWSQKAQSRSRKAANTWMAWHLGDVISDVLASNRAAR